MAYVSLLAGTTSKIVEFPIYDSSSTTGALLAGVLYNTSGISAYYHLWNAASAVSMTASLATMTVGTWTSFGFVYVDNTNMPGIYQLGIPNAALASGTGVTIVIKGVTNMVPVVLEIELTAWNNQDGVRGGMTALPNAAAGASGGLPIGTSIKKNTALPSFAFLMTDSTNHAPKTGLGTGVTVTRSIDGGAFGAGALTSVTELANGIYLTGFAAADLNGGVITLQATASGSDTTFVTLVTAQ